VKCLINNLRSGVRAVREKTDAFRGIWKGKDFDRMDLEEEIKAVRRELSDEILKRAERL
jgi:hypothetical protein